MGLVIVNVKEDKIDFKFKLVDKYNFEVSVSNGFLSVPRKTNGILVDFGVKSDFDSRLSSVCERFSFRNMNDIHRMFKTVYLDQIDYLMIDETVVNWSSRHKLLPIKLQ